MASLITVRLDKGASPNLGFRLQGGKDFGTPLVVQKVNGGSPAERAGLLAGDSVIKVNNVDVFNLRHKDAQDVIVRAGPAFEVTVQRGGSVWKPSVIPTGPIHSTAPTVTKTSLAATKKENIGNIGTGHNLSAKPFSPQLNGAVNGGPKVVNNQYNSPLKLYSEESIAETLSAQTEVLSTGALGVNFKKNERSYDATNSAVYRMLQEAEKEPKTPEPVSPRPDLHAVGGRQVTSPRSNTPLDDHSRLSSRLGDYPNSNNPNQEGVTKCSECERVIVGVFVRIKDKNLHVECFKCSTCGTSLKNVGYYNINNKLYCDVHAKLAARANPPAPNLLPITVPPGGKAPASAISTALATHSLPSPSPLSPKTNLAQPFQAGNYSSAPKPFSSVSAPISAPLYNTLPRAAPAAAPLSPVALAPAPSYSPASSAGRSVHSFVWPPPPEEPEVPTACPLYVAPASHLKVNPKTIQQEDVDNSDTISDSEDFEVHEFNMYQPPKMSLCSEEVCQITGRRSATECIETISETLETQKLVESVMKNRPKSPPPLDRDVVISGIKTATESSKIIEKNEQVCSVECSSVASCESKTSCELKRLTDFKPNTVECKLKSQIENVVPQKWESPMVQALRTIPDKDKDPFTQIPTKVSSGVLASALAIAPSEPFVAQQPFTSVAPVPLPEETEPYFPPEHPLLVEPKEPKPEKPDSQFVKALQTAPERSFTPVGGAPVKKKKNPTDELLKDLPKPQAKLTMRQALTTASDRPYSPLFAESVQVEETLVQECKIGKEKKNVQKPLKPEVLPASFQKSLTADKPRAPKPFPITAHEKKQEISIHEKKEEKEVDVKTSSSKVIETHKTHSTVEESVENLDDDKSQGMYPLFKGFSCSFGNKSEHSQFTIEISTTPPIITREGTHTPSVKISRTGESSESITEKFTEESKRHEKSLQETKQIEKQSEQVEVKKPTVALALHKPERLPQYQVNLSENLEADYLMRQRIESAKIQHEKTKVEPPPKPPREFSVKPVITVQPSEPPRGFLTKPVITVQPGGTALPPEQSFKPVCDDRPPSSTFSPRPRPITPSMINKPPPVIPYYQSSLVAQQYRAAQVNLLDPASPAVSRSPSPCPERRSPSPFPSKAAAAVRPKSPAAGPPPNPLTSGKPVPTPRDAKVEQAKKNVSEYIPQYREKMDGVERVQPEATQVYNAYVQAQNVSALQQVQQKAVSHQQSLQVDLTKKVMMKEDRQVEDAARAQVMSQQLGQATVSTAIYEQSHLDHLEQLKKSESQSVESLQGGAIQVQRKKTVTEEFEHTQKSKMMQIEKNVSSTKSHPFREVKNPEQQAILGMHVTNPQPIASPFLKANASQQSSAPLPKQQTQPKPQQVPPPTQQQPVLVPPPPRQQPQPSQAPRPFKHVLAPSTASPIKHVPAPSGSAKKPDQSVTRSNIPVPNAGSGSGGGRQAGAIGVAPKRGRGVLNTSALTGTRIPLCASCHSHIRGPFITALGKIWCPDHFICATPSCRRPLQDLGFVEEQGQLYCEYCFEQYLAPTCAKCNTKVKGDCLKAIGKNFHPECFCCFYCGKLFGNSPFFLEDGNPYCDADWNELFTTKCFACGFPVEAGDRWVEALNNNYHSQCFNCTMCKKNLEGQSFFAKGGRPFCKNHAR